jgi:hypothetical protein
VVPRVVLVVLLRAQPWRQAGQIFVGQQAALMAGRLAVQRGLLHLSTRVVASWVLRSPWATLEVWASALRFWQEVALSLQAAWGRTGAVAERAELVAWAAPAAGWPVLVAAELRVAAEPRAPDAMAGWERPVELAGLMVGPVFAALPAAGPVSYYARLPAAPWSKAAPGRGSV